MQLKEKTIREISQLEKTLELVEYQLVELRSQPANYLKQKERINELEEQMKNDCEKWGRIYKFENLALEAGKVPI